MKDQLKFVFISIGIIGIYCYHAIIDELLMRGKYGNKINDDESVGEKFTYSITLVSISSLWCWIFAKIALIIMKPKNEDKTHFGYYACSSLASLLANVSSSMALRWSPYPSQVIARSAKPIPVMLLSVFIARKVYTIQRYIFVTIIVVGVALSIMKMDLMSSNSRESILGIGEILLIFSLLMDGVLGGVQERIRGEYAPNAMQMMCAMNGWSAIMLIPVALISGDLIGFIKFVQRFPIALTRVATLMLLHSIGAVFIFNMVALFGSLACSVVTTTRKLFTILYSVIFMANPLSYLQWFGVSLVFIGIFADTFFGSTKKTNEESEREDSTEFTEQLRPKHEIV